MAKKRKRLKCCKSSRYSETYRSK
uniref:Uncharacterized protein n=1 Tax=Arundo donax TaxID=35708 RepID=A0A0A9G4H4_ARUDO